MQHICFRVACHVVIMILVRARVVLRVCFSQIDVLRCNNKGNMGKQITIATQIQILSPQTTAKSVEYCPGG